MTRDRFIRATLGASLLGFLVAGDVGLAPVSLWHGARLLLLGLAVASAAGVAAAQPRALRALARPPLVFFTAFGVLALVASACADRPLPALRYGVGLVAVEMVAVAAATAFADRTLVVGLYITLAAKLTLSLAFVASPAGWWASARFKGALGSPNPMGAAAGLAFLLIVLHGWYDWPRARSRIVLAALGLAATTMMAATRSLSAVAATLATLPVLLPFSRARESGWTARVIWAMVSAALLAPLAISSGGGGGMPARPLTAAQATSVRLDWWSTLVEAVWRHPWLGYGAGSTPSLGLPGTPPWGTSAHNLYLEAAVYAGIPGAIAMALFVAATLLAILTAVGRARSNQRLGLAIPAVFYTVLSVGEPVLLNGAPSTLVVPLIVAAVCAADAAVRPEQRAWPR